MIPVLHYHVLGIPHGLILPLLISDVLPPRNLRKHQKPQFIAPVKKMMRLRIMRGTHRIQLQFVFQNICIPFLHGFRHRISHIRIALVPVQSPQFQLPSIQIKTVPAKMRFPEPDPRFHRIQARTVPVQLRTQCVQERMLHIPHIDLLKGMLQHIPIE